MLGGQPRGRSPGAEERRLRGPLPIEALAIGGTTRTVAALAQTPVGEDTALVGSIGPILQDRATLALTAQDIGPVAAFYVLGAVSGAVFFGWLADRFGRRPNFNVTFGIYLLP